MAEVRLSKLAKGLDKAYKKAQGLNVLVDKDVAEAEEVP
jgi:hypothetical protein